MQLLNLKNQVTGKEKSEVQKVEYFPVENQQEAEA